MKKETVKEMLEKVMQKLKSSKKDILPAVMAMMALAAVIGLTVHAYRTEVFETGTAASSEATSDPEKEKPGGSNQTKIRSKAADNPDAVSASIQPVSGKVTDETEEEKGTEGSKKEAVVMEEKSAEKTRSDENTAAQIGSSERAESRSSSGSSQKPEAQSTGAAAASEQSAVPVSENQQESPASVPAWTSPASAATPVQESAPAGQPASVPQPVQQETTPAPEPAHEHTWVPVTVTIHHDAVTHTVHHDAVTQTVHHDAVTHEEPVYEFRTICNTCGADITGHIPDHIGSVCIGTYGVQQVQTGVNVVTDQEAYDEEVIIQEAWDETVTDQAAYDDVVTTGYRCSICGAAKQ